MKIDNPYEIDHTFTIYFIKNLILFTLKILILYLLFIFLISPNIPKIPESKRNKLIAISFVHNPYVLFKLSELEEDKGHLDNAIQYSEAALALMEMNNANEKYIYKYKLRLVQLKSL